MSNIGSVRLVCAAVLCLLFYGLPAAALTVRSGNQAAVSSGETINGTLVISGETVSVNGSVKGDVICAGQTVEIGGAVDGDVICAGQTLKVSNNVGGSVRAAAQTIEVTGRVNRNATLAAQSVKSDSEISGEMLFAAQSAAIGGNIGQDIAGAANSIILSGRVGGNAQLRNRNLNITDAASIGGALTYVSANDAVIAQGSNIAGGSRRYDPPADKKMGAVDDRGRNFSETVIGAVLKLIFYLFFALIFVLMFKNPAAWAADAMLTRPGMTLGIGFLFLVLTPIVVTLLIITIIGIPVGLVVMFFFMAAMFLAMLLAAIATGRRLAMTNFFNRLQTLTSQTVVGVVVLWILFEIPVIGAIAMVLACAWGLGGVYRMFKGTRQ